MVARTRIAKPWLQCGASAVALDCNRPADHAGNHFDAIRDTWWSSNGWTEKGAMDVTTLYVAGPMRGLPQFNFPEFDRVSDLLRLRGYRVISPADLDRDAGIELNHVGSDQEFIDACIRRDVDAILESDGLALLDGWDRSVGATAEVGLARWRRISIRHWTAWPSC